MSRTTLESKHEFLGRNSHPAQWGTRCRSGPNGICRGLTERERQVVREVTSVRELGDSLGLVGGPTGDRMRWGRANFLTVCADHATELECTDDDRCRWLVPGCDVDTLPAAGCFPREDCGDNWCGPKSCTYVATDECLGAFVYSATDCRIGVHGPVVGGRYNNYVFPIEQVESTP